MWERECYEEYKLRDIDYPAQEFTSVVWKDHGVREELEEGEWNKRPATEVEKSALDVFGGDFCRYSCLERRRTKTGTCMTVLHPLNKASRISANGSHAQTQEDTIPSTDAGIPTAQLGDRKRKGHI